MRIAERDVELNRALGGGPRAGEVRTRRRVLVERHTEICERETGVRPSESRVARDRTREVLGGSFQPRPAPGEEVTAAKVEVVRFEIGRPSRRPRRTRIRLARTTSEM